MRTRDLNPTEPQTSPPAAEGGGTANEDARRRARRLLDFGDDIIDKVLSRDSQQFLSQNRQQGGQ